MIADKIKNARTILYYITIIIVGIICTYKKRMQNNFLSQLADFNYPNIGGMSFWTPHVILISAGIELFVFTFLAIHSYCRHQVA